MTLDEAIEERLKVIKVQEKLYEESYSDESKEIIKSATDNDRQLVEWLTDYKELKNSIGAVKLKDMKEAVGLLQELNAENDQLTSQLAEAKRLLKAAVKDLSITVAEVYNGGLVCECCKWKSRIDGCCCPNDGGCDVAYQWRYVDEALKLLNDEK